MKKSPNLNDEIPDHKKKKGKDRWFIGNKEPIKPEFFSDSVGIKWTKLKKWKEPKKLTPKNTITILIKGKHKVTLWPSSVAKKKIYLLEKKGDYVFVRKGIQHSWETLGQDNLILTVCW
jgi:hypothetical protein